MSNPYESGKAALDELVLWAEEHVDDAATRNEATTRLHLIDSLLHRCLGWPMEQIEAEENYQGTYTDYILGKPQRRLIVDAKKEGVHFTLPIGLTGNIHPISSLIDGEAGRQLKNAAVQVSGYCATRGVAMAAVCNGTALVAFLAVRTDGIPPLQGRALVFSSLDDMRANFRLLWDNLSPAAVEARQLHLALKSEEAPSPPDPLSAHIPHYPGYKRRNELQVGLQILGELFVEDLTRVDELRVDFLTYCYASSGALSQYALIGRQILQSRYAMLHEKDEPFEVAPAVNKRGLNPALSGDILASGMSQRPVVLLGDVGVGKTMFIQHLINIDARDLFRDAITVYIDFGKQPTLANDLNTFIVDETVAQLLQRHGIDIDDRDFVYAVHHGALNRFDRGIFGDLKEIDQDTYRRERLAYVRNLTSNRADHLSAALNHLRATQRRLIVVFLDNIDQRPLEFQERVFLIAEGLAANWPATVFVSLRPDSFYRSRNEGVLTAYQPRVFTISPPRVDVVIKRRLEFAQRQLKESSRLASFPAGLTLQSNSLEAYLDVLRQNFDQNERLITLIDNLAAGNIRLALGFIGSFIGSGHVDTAKILEVHNRSGRYTIPVHEFLRAIIYGDHAHYDPAASPIANLFAISRPDGREHFLTAILVCFTQVRGEKLGKEGYVSSDELFSHAQGLGFDADQVATSLQRAVGKRLLEQSPRYAELNKMPYFRVTTVGAYTARVLSTMFAYVDAMIVDTPIVDEAFRGVINDVYAISERVARAEYFRAYLDKQWLPLSGLQGAAFDWRPVSDALRADTQQVGRRVDPETYGWGGPSVE